MVVHVKRGGDLVHTGRTVAVGEGPGRPIAIVPPAPGKRVSHLVVGAFSRTQLLVFSLPGLVLVHTYELSCDNICLVMGLAADPCGGALAVYDFIGQGLHVLPWPLTGMSPLE